MESEMVRFLAIKTNYDNRQSLPPHLKYSRLPTFKEYNHYLKRFHEENIGGNGFHECLNFAIPENGNSNVNFYIPPTCLPKSDSSEDELVIFTFTYKKDPSLPAHIVGVHGGVKLLSREGIEREEEYQIQDIREPLHYHATSKANLTTLFVPPISYDNTLGLHTPTFEKWGFGLRYIEEQHAKNIIKSAFQIAIDRLETSSTTERQAIEREIKVLINIDERYGLNAINKKEKLEMPNFNGNAFPSPENGFIGESFVYRNELSYVKQQGLDEKMVEWISQTAPSSPFDIKSVRLVNGEIQDHYIEVKTIAIEDSYNIYLSSYQLNFMEQHKENSNLVLVQLNKSKQPSILQVYTHDDILQSFDLLPIKYKLIKK